MCFLGANIWFFNKKSTKTGKFLLLCGIHDNEGILHVLTQKAVPTVTFYDLANEKQ